MFTSGLKMYCSPDCGAKLALEMLEKKKKIESKAQAKVDRAEHKKAEEAVITRSEWYKKLEKEVNGYVRLRDYHQACCTCGTRNDIKYDAGHYRSVGSCQELRFELTNIHKQCSLRCNSWGSGMRSEYREFIVHHYGQEHLDWLDSKHKLLKEQYPDVEDIKQDIAKFKQMIKDEKLKLGI